MKSTGIVRCLDSLGRVVIPIELRRVLEITPRTPVEIFSDEDMVILKKFNRCCSICGSEELAVTCDSMSLCQNCLDKLNSEAAKNKKEGE